MSELIATKNKLEEVTADLQAATDPEKRRLLILQRVRLQSSYDYCVFINREMYGETLKKEIG